MFYQQFRKNLLKKEKKKETAGKNSNDKHRKNLYTTAIYKTRNARTGNEMREMQRTQGILTRILGNLLENS